ncbi:FKBP-type peptidyl-prolyl cis-trans isomerase [Massilia jejuensis]|uniref:Peptidyl-prolyl cis-trans isomerase n=1 Tax=Massilia jejuensis TaxID=648894 RepID=A0ABW0PL09_9BURK
MKYAIPALGLALALSLPLAAGIASAAPAAPAAPAARAQQLQTVDTVVGKGKQAAAGNTVKVHYTGWLFEPKAPRQRGKQFDSSVGGEAFTFPLGMGGVIKGWDLGVAGMKVGGKRTLIIPPELGYGARGAGPIPPGATLMFDVELLDVK